jgi:Tfp pilus assembly protein PilZ
MQKTVLSRDPEGAAAESVVEKVRVPFIQRASLTRGGQRADVLLLDLGLAGVFVELQDPPALGEQLEVCFCLPGNSISISARSEVAWRRAPGTPPSGSPPGAGLRFVEIQDGAGARIREYLREYCQRDTQARRFARQWPVPGDEGGNR